MVRQESIRKISSSLQIHRILTVFDCLYHCLYVSLDRVFSFSIVTSKREGVVIEIFFSCYRRRGLQVVMVSVLVVRHSEIS